MATKTMRFVGTKFYTNEANADGSRKFITNGDLHEFTEKQLVAFADMLEDPEILEKQVAEARSRANEAKVREEEARQLKMQQQEELRAKTPQQTPSQPSAKSGK